MDFFNEGKKRFRERRATIMEQRLQDAGYAFGIFDCDCLGALTRVLTSNGWKRIVDVTTDDLLWDGVEWVKHDGLIHRGESETIDFRGIAVTADHKILQDGGEWVEAKDASPDRVVVTGEASSVEAHHATGKQAVYDLLNAGPRNRFTVCGADGVPFIVHNCACAAAPNYQPVADASKEAAEVTAQLGREQLAEAKRQYDMNLAVSKPVTDAQLALMQQTKTQGDDYYNYMVAKQRPVEDALNAEAMGGQPNAATQAQMELAADRAAADARQGTTQQQNQLIRQGLRYGYSPAKIAAMTGANATQSGLGIASAMNQGREKEGAKSWAKKLDVAGLYRGLPGASQGAYSLANQSGNSAVQNQMQPGNQLLGAMNNSAQTQIAGQQMALQGLTGIMNAQASYANGVNSAMNSGGSGLGGLGSLMGGAAALWKASDRRMKENIEAVGRDENTGLVLYEFNYLGAPDRRFRGFMADEVESQFPEAVHYDDLGFASVDYGLLGTDMVEVK